MPLEHQIQIPRLVNRIAGAIQNLTCSAIAIPVGNLGVVASCHVEIGACEVALVFIVWFPHLARVAWSCTVAQTSLAIVFAIGKTSAAFTFAIRIAAALVVHVTIGRIHMEEVALHW